MSQLSGGLIALGIMMIIVFIIFLMIGKDSEHGIDFLNTHAKQVGWSASHYK
jgi:hypothetical protein